MLLKIIEGNFVISKIPKIKDSLLTNEFVFLGITNQEISLVCKKDILPIDVLEKEEGYLMIRIEGVLDFSLIGILAKLSDILAENNISIFVLSTFNTDYFLVKEEQLQLTKTVLIEKGYSFQ